MSARARTRGCAASCAFAGLCCVAALFVQSHAGQPVAGVAAASAGPQGSSWQASPATSHPPILAEVFVNGVDSAHGVELSRLQDGHLAVDLSAFATALQLPLRVAEGVCLLHTPLGVVRIDASSVVLLRKRRFVRLATLRQLLAAQLAFDAPRQALRVRPPWRAGQAVAPVPVPGWHGQPVLRPPAFGLSGLHSEFNYASVGGGAARGSWTELGGPLAGGVWRANVYGDASTMGGHLANWAWIGGRGRARWLLGQGPVQLSSLLPPMNLGGVQRAWTNQPALVYAAEAPQEAALGASAILGDHFQGGRAVRGAGGPPGGSAQLRVDGRVVATTIIRLDGTWAFHDVLLQRSDHVEVALYRPFADGYPVAVRRIDVALGSGALPAGVLTSFAGLGVDTPWPGSWAGGSPAGFYQWRRGISSGLTVGAAVEHGLGGSWAMFDAVRGLGALGVWRLEAATHGRAQAWSLRGGAALGPGYWRASWMQVGARYLQAASPSSRNASLQVGWRASRRLDVSLVARSVDDAGIDEHQRFVAPAMRWAPSAQLSLSVMPDYLGNQDYEASWMADADNAVDLSRYAGNTQLQWQHETVDGSSCTLGAMRVARLGTRYEALLSATRAGAWSPLQISGGPLFGAGHVGWQLSVASELLPGLSLQLQMQRDPLAEVVAGGDATRLQLLLVADFGIGSSGIVPGSGLQGPSRDGGVAGRVGGSLPQGMRLSDLRGVAVRVDGRSAAHLDAQGRYEVDGLQPGVHRVVLDEAGLPMDIGTRHAGYWVEVQAGVTTRVDFRLELRLGFAGRVLRRAAPRPDPVADARVVVRNRHLRVVRRVHADALGFYRVDGLRPGLYWVDAGGVRRRVRLRDRFVYGQDVWFARVGQGAAHTVGLASPAGIEPASSP